MVEKMTNLKNISIVLVEPKEPGNIGSCCRAMKNMGITSLRLVNPVPYLVPDTFRLCYGADDLVQAAVTYTDLKSALADTSFSVGTTRRKGKHRKPVYWLSEVLPEITSYSQKNRVAIVFGRETKGLSNDELALCSAQVSIPTRNDFPTLNLAQSVLLVCYELFLTKHPPEKTIHTFVPQGELEQMYDHVCTVLTLLGYNNKGRGLHTRILAALKRIFKRSSLEPAEVKMIHGLCSQIELKLSDKSGID